MIKIIITAVCGIYVNTDASASDVPKSLWLTPTKFFEISKNTTRRNRTIDPISRYRILVHLNDNCTNKIDNISLSHSG